MSFFLYFFFNNSSSGMFLNKPLLAKQTSKQMKRVKGNLI